MKGLKNTPAEERENTVRRRLNNSSTRGLGYWGAVDYMKKVHNTDPGDYTSNNTKKH